MSSEAEGYWTITQALLTYVVAVEIFSLAMPIIMFSVCLIVILLISRIGYKCAKTPRPSTPIDVRRHETAKRLKAMLNQMTKNSEISAEDVNKFKETVRDELT